MKLTDLGLTPTQLHELEQQDQTLVEEWLEALAHQHGLRTPTGWFLAGVRSGVSPQAQHDQRRDKAIALAEKRVRNLAYAIWHEHELQAELFDRQGLLHAWAGDQLLEQRMLRLWRDLRNDMRPPIDWTLAKR
jgi:hypothetical protein